MLDSSDLIKSIQKISVVAVENAKPMEILFGTVVGLSPLSIQVEQKLVLGEQQLILSRNVTDYSLEMTVSHETEQDSHNHHILDTYSGGGESSVESHCHGYVGRKIFLVHNSLLEGERVILLRLQGGQKFLVLDRVVNL